MMHIIRQEINKALKKAGISGDIQLSQPPNPKMGDLAFPCFSLAKEQGKSPVEIANQLVENLEKNLPKYVKSVSVAGPYVNFSLDTSKIVKEFTKLPKDTLVNSEKSSNKEKIMVEFAHPNTHKAFHIGHLRNIITGESLVRLYEHAGNEVIRVNYQGDVGMHIAKSLWGIQDLSEDFEKVKNLSLEEKAKFLGKAYAHGAQAFEEESKKAEIVLINEKIYKKDPSIKEVYELTRSWSLEYFDLIYKRLGTNFDRLYFESEVADSAIELINKETGKVLTESQGAIIFEGSKHGLHDRVFLNSKGFPTYEGKDLALSELQNKEYNPDKIIHITGSEQSEYFKVVFKAIEQVFPKLVGKEQHIPYGWVKLKQGKMSSRSGKVVLAESLLQDVNNAVATIAKDLGNEINEETKEAVSQAAVKYSFLQSGVNQEISFDLKESVSLTGNSGPYLLYSLARINSIFANVNKSPEEILLNEEDIPLEITEQEKQLFVSLLSFKDAAKKAISQNNPSEIAKYVYVVAQEYSRFYEKCPILDSKQQAFRLWLAGQAHQVISKSLYLLGIKTVEKM